MRQQNKDRKTKESMEKHIRKLKAIYPDAQTDAISRTLQILQDDKTQSDDNKSIMTKQTQQKNDSHRRRYPQK